MTSIRYEDVVWDLDTDGYTFNFAAVTWTTGNDGKVIQTIRVNRPQLVEDGQYLLDF